MTKIHIFLGSSLDELHLDSETMGNYVRKLNDIYMDRDIWIQLDRGDELEEYNEEIQQSDIFLVLFYNQAGQDTIEQFHKALKQFQNTGAPAILTFFRQGEGYDPKQSVLKFMDELGEQLGHYFKKYTHIDTVKLVLLLQMKLMKLDVPIEVEESLITVGGTPVLTLENIPMWAENIDFQSLKKQYQACERAYLDAKAATTDPVTDPVFLQASKQWHEAKKALRKLEQELFEIALKIEEKSNDGTLTERQRKAYELMEQGDTEGAKKIMDLREILDDAKQIEAWKQQMNQQADEKLEQNVQELLLRIEILKTQVQNPSRFEEIQETFEEAVGIEERNGLTKNAMWEYVSYLHNQHDYNRAIPLAERYLKYAELDGDKSDIADAANMLGLLYKDTDCMELAEREYLRAKDIYECLVIEDPKKFLPNLAIICNNLGVVYMWDGKEEEAIKLFENIKERLIPYVSKQDSIYKLRLNPNVSEQDSIYKLRLNPIFRNIIKYYVSINMLEEAEKQHQYALEIFGERPSGFQYIRGKYIDVEHIYIDLRRIEKLRKEKGLRGRYFPSVSDFLNGQFGIWNVAYFPQEELDPIRQSITCRNTNSLDLSFNEMLHRLADSQYTLGKMHYVQKKYHKASEVYEKALEIYEYLSFYDKDCKQKAEKVWNDIQDLEWKLMVPLPDVLQDLFNT